jgi:transposase
VELTIVQTAKQHHAQALDRLHSVPGSGKLLRLVLLYAMPAITRFPRVHDVVSYCRLVQGAKESAGQRYGTTGAKIGHASLQWAFSEAALLCLRNNPVGQKYLARLEPTHGKGKALTVFAHTWARAVYYLVRRDTVCDMATCLPSSGRGAREPAAALGHDGASLATVLGDNGSRRRRTPMSP